MPLKLQFCSINKVPVIHKHPKRFGEILETLTQAAQGCFAEQLLEANIESKLKTDFV